MNSNQAKSSGTAQKWLIGCGIGCGVVILILIGLGLGGYFFFRNVARGFKDTEAMMTTLTERYGRINDFCPDPDGAIRPERMEAFLSARAAFAPARKKIESSFEILIKEKGESEMEDKKSKSVFEKITAGIGLLPQISEYLKSRNQALLDAGIGMGEYYYIYIISYYSWLGKSPIDGPDIQRDEGEKGRIYWRREELREERKDLMLRRTHRQIFPMLRNQLEKLMENEKSGSQAKWRKTLEAEIKALERDNYRLPWQDGLPSVIESSLRPFRERLEAGYSSLTNSLELAIEQRER